MPFWPDRFHLETVRSGTAAVPFVGALDGFTPFMAWSHRRALLTSFTGDLLQARRTSDDAPYNVARKANGEGDTAGLLSFVGGSSAAVASVTEQVGTGYDFIQPTTDSQRMIVDGGSLVTVGGKAASRGLRAPTGTPDHGGGMYTNQFTAQIGNVFTLFLRGNHGSYSGDFLGIIDSYFGFGRDSSYYRQLYHSRSGPAGIGGLGDFGGSFTDDFLISLIFDGTNVTFRDGTSTYTIAYNGAVNVDRFLWGLYNSTTGDTYSSDVQRMQEAAVWMSDQTANEAAIRSALLA